jgi:hypothetical protein
MENDQKSNNAEKPKLGIFVVIKRFFMCLFGKHEWECSDIHNGTLNELSAWCKHCGYGWKP